MKLPKAVLDRFRAFGRAGGRARAARMSAGDRRAVATTAAIRRWTSARFGAASFGALGLPGGEIVDAGLDALASGVSSVESLAVSLAAPRLRREGVPLPDHVIPDAELRLFRLLEQSSGELAHARYLAYLRQVASFADACSAARMP